MGLKVKESCGGGNFTPAPAGLHRAVCISYVDIGTHDEEYQGETKERSSVALTWELPDEMIDVKGEQKPQVVSKFYTKSLHEKSTLRHDLASWRSIDFTDEELEGFDLDNILGKACQVNVVHAPRNAGGVRAKVTAVLPLSKGMTKPTPSIEPWRYDLGDDGYNFPPQLSDKMKTLIIGEKGNPKKPGCKEMQVVNDLPGNPYGENPAETYELDDNPALNNDDSDVPF